MATPTTTFAAIRDSLVTAVEALTPSVATAETHSTVKFAFAPKLVDYDDFRDWCELNDNAAFRYFDIVETGWEPQGLSDLDIQRRRSTFELTLAYPHHYALYGAGNRSDMLDTIEGDTSQVLAAVGIHGAANFPAAAEPVSEAVEPAEPGDGTTFAAMTVVVDYYYDTN